MVRYAKLQVTLVLQNLISRVLVLCTVTENQRWFGAGPVLFFH